MRDPFDRPLFFDGTFPAGRLACPSVIDAALQTTDATAFLAAFGHGKFWGGPWGSELDAMSRDARMLRMSDWLLWTRKHPDSFVRHDWLARYGRDFERWLHEFGAIDTARYVREMLDLYPDGVPFPTEIERGKHLQALAKANPEIWKELRARYPGIENELAATLRLLLEKRGRAIGADCDALRARFAEPMPRTLQEIADTPSTDAEFSDALITWLDAPKGRPALGFDDQPATGRILWVLDALNTSLVVSGMSHFLYSVGIGRYFPKLAIWAKKVGAPTTVAYAKAASAELEALNGGTLPSMVDAKRIATMHELEEHDEAAGGRGLFDALDQEYRVLVTAELSQRLRAYVREHVEDIEHELFAAVEAHRAKS